MKKKIINILSWIKAVAEVFVPVLMCVLLVIIIRIMAE